MWQVSQFTVVRNLADHALPTHNLVFNTQSGRCMILRDPDWQRILAALPAPEKAAADVRHAIEGLVEARVVVSAATDERQAFGASFDALRYHPQRIFPLIAVTTACNIGCTYCYEEGTRSLTMSTKVVAGVLHWLEQRIVQDGIREIYPGLFGGEPLMYPRLLFALMDGFHELRQRYGIQGEFYSSSNGIMLTPQLAEQLAQRGLTQLQISLDGTEEIHNERRIGKKGQPSFQESLRGIKIAIEHIRNVTVKVNFDRHNHSSISALFDRLIAEGLQKRVDVKLEAIAYQMPGSRVQHDPVYVIPPESVEMADAYLELMVEAKQRGLKVTQDTAHTTPCMFSSHHGVIIGPEGNIYKCISLVGRPEFKVGTVFDDEYDTEEYERQMDTTKRISQCYEEKCPYIPVCAGGCAYESVVRTNRYDLRYCTRQKLEAFHYKRYLIRYQKQLEALGMRPLSAQELHDTAVSAPRGTSPAHLVPLQSIRKRSPGKTSPVG